MLDVLARRRDVLRNQREALLAKIRNGETGDPLNDFSGQLWEVRSRLIVYGDFEIMDDPPAEFVEMWKGSETDDPEKLRNWIRSRAATADRIISSKYPEFSDEESELLKKQGIAVKDELETIGLLIGGIWIPRIISAWKGDSE